MNARAVMMMTESRDLWGCFFCGIEDRVMGSLATEMGWADDRSLFACGGGREEKGGDRCRNR